jgi:hypothetical protein
MRISGRFTLAIALAVLVATASVAAASSVPVLGSSQPFAPSGKGFGSVKPKTVFLGGDPTGLFKKLKWTGWGNSKATGKGKGFYDPPNKPGASVKVPVTLVASSLGQCKGHLAYKKLAITFLYHGHKKRGTTINACNGPR